MFYSNEWHQSIENYKFQYKLYFSVNMGYYRVLFTNLICSAELVKSESLIKYKNLTLFASPSAHKNGFFSKYLNLPELIFWYVQLTSYTNAKNLKLEWTKLDKIFSGPAKYLFMKFVLKKVISFCIFLTKIPKNQNFKIKCTTTMYSECSVKISDFSDCCCLFSWMFFKLHLIAKYFIKIVLTARFVDIFPSLKMKILLNPFVFLLFRHPIMQLKEKK